MPRAKRLIESAVTIDGFSLIWRLHREQQWSAVDESKGISIHVRVSEGVRKELHMEYPLEMTHRAGAIRRTPVQPRILPAKVEAHIREAMADGWDPASRGKPYVYVLEELPN